MKPTFILETTAYTPEQLQTGLLPQLALTGRSNVGKSSLINALAGKKHLAKTSAVPGKTRSVNYYRAYPHNFLLVDLPGYGYAQYSKSEQEKWASLIEQYLSSATSLRGLLLLLDCRVSPQKNDLALAALARDKRIPILPVLTKADKCTRQEQNARLRAWSAVLGIPPILTSAAKSQGIDDVWQAMRHLTGNSEADIRSVVSPALPSRLP